MSLTNPDDLRTAYLNFFAQRRHSILPSAALVPENDPTTLFTGSGMQPMLPYLLGQSHPQGKRIADSQKCFRSQDIEEVGDNRHTTFFEMLGNWSLGDYFKREQLGWFFGFLTDELGLAPERLYVTVYQGNESLGIPADQEAIEIWQELFASKGITAKVVADSATQGMGDGRIFLYDDSKNWWSRVGAPQHMPNGEPGGPDSEVFYDFGEKFAGPTGVNHINADCERYMEIGNSVFMTYQKTVAGFQPLVQKNIDFGGGLERQLAAVAGNPDVFLTGALCPLITRLEEITGRVYHQDAETTYAMRVIADHVRAAIMLAADGVLPGNKEQGYFARRLVRRSVRYAFRLGLHAHFVADLVPVVAELYGKAYPTVIEQQAAITSALTEEEQRFAATLEKGLHEFSKNVAIRLSADQAFYLYETYGFPLELSLEEAAKQSIKADPDLAAEFAKLRQNHAEQSRTQSVGMFKGGLADHSQETTRFHTATHLLHAALRQVLGKHVHQQGSNITKDRLRFDFSHPQAMTPTELQAVEQQVRAWIDADLPVTRQVMTKEAALAQGALAFFGDKYGAEVSVYTIGQDPETNWVSKELCGGPHVTHTGEVGKIQIEKEKSVGSGTRRLYLVSVAIGS